ncbi:MAG TPA: hypothetical protein VJM50_09305 [Pyrinomonadaceae bacterium]|nr:hypothetical protein [Pyrinomonadaceae bacterium]
MYSRILQNGSTVSFILIATLVSAVIVGALLKVRHASSSVETLTVPASERRVQVVRFTLYDTGIYPHEARANPGSVTISIEDLTGSSDGLLIQRVDTNGRVPVGALNKAARLLRMRKELQLPRGTYELVDSTRPENRALLIVAPEEF